MAEIKGIPVYKLYGELEPWPTPDMVHCESIAARSRLNNWHIKPHQHNGLFQILYLQSGNAHVQLDDTYTIMHPGAVLMIPQNCIHGFQFESNTVGYVATLAYPLMSRLIRTIEGSLAGLPQPRLHVLGKDEESMHIRTAFDAFWHEYRGTAPHRNLLVETLLAAILCWLSRHVAQSSPPAHPVAKSSRHFARFSELVEKWYDKHYPVSRYAREIGITAAHLNLLCRQLVQKSPLDVIHARLLLEAKRSLFYTTMTINEVSYAMGFSDPAYFTRFFKRQTGVAPKDFRRQAEKMRVAA